MSVHRPPLLNGSTPISSQGFGPAKLALRGPVVLPGSGRKQQCLPFQVRAEASESSQQDKAGRRQVIAIASAAAYNILSQTNSSVFAIEAKKGYQAVLDKKDGYEFLYPFGWQEVVVEGQDKVFKDVIEPLESVSVNMVVTGKEDVKELGSPQEVAEALVRKVLAPSNQKTKVIGASEHQVEGKNYYSFEFVAQAPNFTRHALGVITIGNGKFYTLTTGANERRWGKMKEKLQGVIDSFKIFSV
ncbi:psbP-like protein 1 [Wolffia australiana]